MFIEYIGLSTEGVLNTDYIISIRPYVIKRGYNKGKSAVEITMAAKQPYLYTAVDFLEEQYKKNIFPYINTHSFVEVEAPKGKMLLNKSYIALVVYCPNTNTYRVYLRGMGEPMLVNKINLEALKNK